MLYRLLVPGMYSQPKNHVQKKGKTVSTLQPKREFSHKVETEGKGNASKPFTWHHKFIFCFLLQSRLKKKKRKKGELNHQKTLIKSHRLKSAVSEVVNFWVKL